MAGVWLVWVGDQKRPVSELAHFRCDFAPIQVNKEIDGTEAINENTVLNIVVYHFYFPCLSELRFGQDLSSENISFINNLNRRNESVEC